MATALDSMVGGGESRERSVVVDYSAEVRRHEKEGVVSYALVIGPVYSNGARGRNALWVWLDTAASARALLAALPKIAAKIDEVDETQVGDKAWAPRPAPKAAAKAAPASAPAPKKSALDALLGDLPA